MDNIKNYLKGLRDATVYSFAWLMICVIAAMLVSGNETVTVGFLIRLFILCFWGAICFTVSFRNKMIQKKGFVFELTCFYILFIPVEVIMFYLMGIFQKSASPVLWIVFACIVVLMYITSLVIDKVIMRKKAALYTEKLMEYNRE